ncbi:hypothetical protein B7463_g3886, partial [Scytalidium lignicola]
MEALIKTHAATHRNDPSLGHSTSNVPLRNQASETSLAAVVQSQPSPPGSRKGSTRLIFKEGKSTYTTDALFAELSSQIEDLHTLLDDDTLDYDQEDHISSDSAFQILSPATSFIPGLSNINVDAQYVQLESSHIRFLWRAYLRNVDPMIKLLHVPSIQAIIEDTVQNRSVSSDINALLWAIYFAAITSLTDDEVYLMFGEKRSQMFPLYKSRLEQALSRANLLNTKHLTTLQAFVLLILCSRSTMPAQNVWILTGLAIRIAKVLGLHRDGELFQLPPFECEMRRRLWWQICYLEVKSSEESGCELCLSEDSFDTKLPLNINDEDIHPESTEPPTERIGLTDMSLSMVRCELIPIEISLLHKMKSITSEDLSRCEALIQHKCKQIHDKYFDGPGVHDPKATAAAAVMDVIAKKISLKLYQQLLCTNQFEVPSLEIQDLLFNKSLDLLESSELLQTDNSITHWSWQSRRNVQWHAIVFTLLQLCTRESAPQIERAWRYLDAAFSRDVEAIEKNEDGLHYQLILRLFKRAKARKNQESNKDQVTPLYNNGTADVHQDSTTLDSIDLPQCFTPFKFDPEVTNSWEIGIGDQANIWETWLDGDINFAPYF